MNDEFEKIFIDALSKTKNSEANKTDIIRLGEQYGLTIPSKTSKANVVAKIVEEGYFDELCEAFSKSLYIPVWKIANYYGVNSDDILQLQRLGVITESPIEKEFFNAKERQFYTANLYNIKIFKHSKEEIQSALKIANSGDSYNIRVETDTKEEIEPLISELTKIFKINNHRIYDRRDGGFNTYISVKTLNNSELEKNVLVEEIQALKKELKDQEIALEKVHNRKISAMQRKIDNRDRKIKELKEELKMRES